MRSDRIINGMAEKMFMQHCVASMAFRVRPPDVSVSISQTHKRRDH